MVDRASGSTIVDRGHPLFQIGRDRLLPIQSPVMRKVSELHADGLLVRPATSADRAEIERLAREGLLPGHVEYQSSEANRIIQSLPSGRERFLVAEVQGRLIGTIAVAEASPDVGQVHWLRVDPRWQTDSMVARRLSHAAADHAREIGLLKLAMHAPADAEERVTSYYRQLGFEFSRTRDIDGVHVLEFYLNLYERPSLRPGSRPNEEVERGRK